MNEVFPCDDNFPGFWNETRDRGPGFDEFDKIMCEKFPAMIKERAKK